ncbi:MAG: preprotein translocase subunit YajC [Holosporales bacterium]|jgi:preprotein translocase subunit YajC|nr:preprotein translocase subunit YajC [Holosporales bacterium]
MILFIGNALADGNTTKGDGWTSFLMLVAFIAILYFLLMRPQQKRQKQHQELVASIKKGDKVVTNSGIIATVQKIPNDQEIILEIADGVQCKFVKSTIAHKITAEAAATQHQPSSKETASAVDENKSKVSKATDATDESTPVTKSKKAGYRRLPAKKKR